MTLFCTKWPCTFSQLRNSGQPSRIVCWQLWNFILWQLQINRFVNLYEWTFSKTFFIKKDNLVESRQKYSTFLQNEILNVDKTKDVDTKSSSSSLIFWNMKPFSKWLSWFLAKNINFEIAQFWTALNQVVVQSI